MLVNRKINFLAALLFGCGLALSAEAQQVETDNLLTTSISPTIELTTKSTKGAVGAYRKNKALSKAPKEKAPDSNIFEGLRVHKVIIRYDKPGASPIIEKFYVVKDMHNPPAHVEDVHYYHKEKRSVMIGTKFKEENGYLMHGSYSKTQGDQILSQGEFYLGAKHGRWETFDKNFVLQEKHYFSKGFPRDSEINYHDTKSTKIKEIIPIQHGLRHGQYIAFYPSGRVAERGQYADGVKIGRWREFNDSDNFPRKREVVHRRRPYDNTEPYVAREWDSKGKLIVDVRK
jgi:antitoxin component YwqK of YwqJK toxin-antitoxin module